MAAVIFEQQIIPLCSSSSISNPDNRSGDIGAHVTTSSPTGSRIAALIVTGHDHFHHRWRAATTAFREILEETGRFDVRVVEEFRGASASTLDPYDAVVLNYFGADVPGETEARWGDSTEQALFDFVRAGRGLVACHTAFRAGDWKDAHQVEFERMLGGVMRSAARRVGDVKGFTVTVSDPDDPITNGLPSTFEQVLDDKFVNLTWSPDTASQVLLTSYDDPDEYLDGAYYAVNGVPGPQLYDPAEVQKLAGVGEHHPVCWKHGYGSGRVFALALGHVGATTLEDARATRAAGRYVGPTGYDAVRSSEFRTLFARGTEWAATGDVTLPLAAMDVPSDGRVDPSGETV